MKRVCFLSPFVVVPREGGREGGFCTTTHTTTPTLTTHSRVKRSNLSEADKLALAARDQRKKKTKTKGGVCTSTHPTTPPHPHTHLHTHSRVKRNNLSEADKLALAARD